jgi:hypothetical protein
LLSNGFDQANSLVHGSNHQSDADGAACEFDTDLGQRERAPSFNQFSDIRSGSNTTFFAIIPPVTNLLGSLNLLEITNQDNAWHTHLAWLNLQTHYDRQVTESQTSGILERNKPCSVA